METKMQCDICSKLFKTDKTLATHKNKFHKEIEKEVVEEENIKIVSDDGKDRVKMSDLKTIEEIIEYIKSLYNKIVDVRFMVTGDDIKWFCCLEKLKNDYEFDTIVDRLLYYKDLKKRNKLIIL